MIRHVPDVTSFPTSLIDMGHRRRPPLQTEIDRLVESFEADGQLVPIGIRLKDGTATLIYGASRLAAAQHLGWAEIRVNAFEGTDAAFEQAEILENLVRRHLDAASQKELTTLLVELREKEIAVASGKELADTASGNSFHLPPRIRRAKSRVRNAAGRGRLAVRQNRMSLDSNGSRIEPFADAPAPP